MRACTFVCVAGKKCVCVCVCVCVERERERDRETETEIFSHARIELRVNVASSHT